MYKSYNIPTIKKKKGSVIKITPENCFKELLLLKINIDLSLFDDLYVFILRIRHCLLDREALSQSPMANLFQLGL